eukprot:421824-Pyramimonas_sp.AAC.1
MSGIVSAELLSLHQVYRYCDKAVPRTCMDVHCHSSVGDEHVVLHEGVEQRSANMSPDPCINSS